MTDNQISVVPIEVIQDKRLTLEQTRVLVALALADHASDDGLMVKSPCRKFVAAGCGSPKARGAKPHTEKFAAFSIPATSFGGSDGMAKAMPVTLRVPRSSTPIRAAAPCGSGTAVVHQAQLEHFMSSPFAASRVDQLIESPRISPRPEKSFTVYALYMGDCVVYIGSSTGLAARIAQHLGSKKQFDSYSFVTVGTIEEMHELEVRCIARFNPQYNCGLNGTSHSGFVGVSRLLLQYGMGSPALKKAAKNHGVETLKVRGSTYYHAAQMQRAIEATGGAA